MIARALLANAPLQIVQAALGFATIWAFTRLMTPDEYGAYALILSLSMLAHTLALTWAEAAAFRFLPTDPAKRADHFATLKRVVIVASALAFLAVALASFIGPHWSAGAFAIAAAFYRFIVRLMRETERAEQRIPRFVAAEIAYFSGGFALGAGLLIVTPLGVAAPFAGLMIVAAALALHDAPELFRRARGGRAGLARLSAYARYGLPLAGALALDGGVQAATRAILTATQGAAEAGAYAAAFGLARPIDLVCAWLGLSAAPVLLAAWKDAPTRAETAARDAGAMLLLIAAPAAAGLALVAQPLTDVMIGEGLRASSARALPWLALAGLFNGLALHFWSEPFQLAQRTGLRAAIIAVCALLQLALTASLAQRFGAEGAAFAAACGAALAAFTLAGAGRRFARFAPPRDAVVQIVSATMVMCGLVLLLPTYPGFPGLAIKCAAGVIAYAAALLVLAGPDLRGLASALLQPISARLTSFRS